jgi:hypothetical protein
MRHSNQIGIFWQGEISATVENHYEWRLTSRLCASLSKAESIFRSTWKKKGAIESATAKSGARWVKVSGE